MDTKPLATSRSSPDASSERVRKFLEDRVRGDPDDITAQNRLADIYLQRLRETGDFEWLRRAGEATCRSLASVPPEQNATGLFMQARVEYESHHFAAARDLVSALTEIEPGKSRGFALLGDALLEFGELDQAETAYGEMQKRKGDPIEAETRLARLDLVRGALDSARMHFEKAIEAVRQLSTPSPEILSWCLVQSGQLSFNLGQWDAAEKNYQAATRLLSNIWQSCGPPKKNTERPSRSTRKRSRERPVLNFGRRWAMSMRRWANSHPRGTGMEEPVMPILRTQRKVTRIISIISLDSSPTPKRIRLKR
jgi:tetratricopeptide (TPR) repeat protein